MIKKIVLLIGLLIFGLLGAFFIWILVLLPVRMVQPVEFMPVEIHEEDIQRVKQKLNLLRDSQTFIDLNREEMSILIKIALEEELKIDINGISVDFYDNEITAIIKVRISDIPSGGYLTRMMKQRNVEYTTTLISAEIWQGDKGFSYSIQEFRIGRFKIPSFVTNRLIKAENSPLKELSISKLEIRGDYVHIERE